MLNRIKNSKTIIIAIIVGFAVTMLAMAVTIYFGYAKAYNSNVNDMNVSLFGIEIYSLIKNGNEYRGFSMGQNMGIICAIFIVGSVCIERIITRCKSKK